MLGIKIWALSRIYGYVLRYRAAGVDRNAVVAFVRDAAAESGVDDVSAEGVVGAVLELWSDEGMSLEAFLRRAAAWEAGCN